MSLRVLHSPSEWATEFPADRRSVLSVGNFDGLHIGHQKILRAVVERARSLNSVALVVTFDPHPMKILRPGDAPLLIATLPQRLAGFERLGLDAVCLLRFDLALSQLSPEAFVRSILSEQLCLRTILVGDNFRFGHRQAGDVRLLREFSSQLGFEVEVVPPVIVRGEVISSTSIRRAVREGRMTRAARLLGRPFALTGEVSRGTGQGRRLVFPTLNLAVEQELLPGRGVYATEVRLPGLGAVDRGSELQLRHRSHQKPGASAPEGIFYQAATNVGVRPTFDGSKLTVESHLFDFSAEITSGPMEVHFWKRLRDEMKFSGPHALRAQIERDLTRARAFFRRLSRLSRNASLAPSARLP